MPSSGSRSSRLDCSKGSTLPPTWPRWTVHSPRYWGRPTFDDELGDLLAFECSWRTRLQPSVDSPLLLPEGQFAAEYSTKDMWRRVFGVGRRKDDLGAVAETVARFRLRHHHQRGWRDTKSLVFSRQAPHGTHGLPTWRRRKFTFALPKGFHFDVAHERERPFALTSADGTSKPYRSHANVDAFGYTRGGS